MNEVERIQAIVSLTLAKLDIQKLKWKDQGYDWHHIDQQGKALLEQTLDDIDAMLIKLTTQ